MATAKFEMENPFADPVEDDDEGSENDLTELQPLGRQDDVEQAHGASPWETVQLENREQDTNNLLNNSTGIEMSTKLKTPPSRTDKKPKSYDNDMKIIKANIYIRALYLLTLIPASLSLMFVLIVVYLELFIFMTSKHNHDIAELAKTIPKGKQNSYCAVSLLVLIFHFEFGRRCHGKDLSGVFLRMKYGSGNTVRREKGKSWKNKFSPMAYYISYRKAMRKRVERLGPGEKILCWMFLIKAQGNPLVKVRPRYFTLLWWFLEIPAFFIICVLTGFVFKVLNWLAT